MGLDESGVLTVGTLASKEGGHTLPHSTLLVNPPWSSKPPFFVGSPTSGQFLSTTWSTRHTPAGWLQT